MSKGKVRVDQQRLADRFVGITQLLLSGVVPMVQMIVGDGVTQSRPRLGGTRVQHNGALQKLARRQRVFRGDRVIKQAGRTQPEVERIRVRRAFGTTSLRPY